MGERDVGQLERSDLEARVARNDVELHLSGKSLLLKLLPDQPLSERRGVNRRLEVGRQVRDRTDVILMPVREDDSRELIPLLLDELEVGEDEIDSRIVRVGERQAEVAHQPLPSRAIEIDVHANLARSAERAENQL